MFFHVSFRLGKQAGRQAGRQAGSELAHEGYRSVSYSQTVLHSYNVTFLSSNGTFSENCEVVRIGSVIIFHLSMLWKAKFLTLFDALFLVSLQGKFEIDQSREWKWVTPGFWGPIHPPLSKADPNPTQTLILPRQSATQCSTAQRTTNASQYNAAKAHHTM